ncbi:MAG: endonuclease/exonuclease/phosphatase family protein [Deltaproteobacteria bacterium]|nr:endonuclease/exonuclease/phosphatase family protein [Deltaproteobacteria bacterium]
MRRAPRICTTGRAGLLAGAWLAIACCARATGETSAPGSSSAGGGGGGDGGGTPVLPKTLCILNWNVHNLVNDKDDDPAPYEEPVSSAKWEAHRKAAGKVLADIDADIAVLQEIENLAVLDALNDEELGGRYVASALVDANDPRGLDIGVLSKIELGEVKSHKDEDFVKVGTEGPYYRYSRDCLEVHLEYNGRRLVLLGVHYKAKENDDPDKRLAEAQRTRQIADEIRAADPAAGIVILGDFNDTPGSPAYSWTVGKEPEEYTNAPESVPEKDRWTFNYNGKLELVDQQMSSPVLAPMLDKKQVRILHTDAVEAASDHAPVVACYEVY